MKNHLLHIFGQNIGATKTKSHREMYSSRRIKNINLTVTIVIIYMKYHLITLQTEIGLVHFVPTQHKNYVLMKNVNFVIIIVFLPTLNQNIGHQKIMFRPDKLQKVQLKNINLIATIVTKYMKQICIA